ncbi:MAG: hypothetical protein AABX05_02695, partial [Nanoarchaeota archaeon]
MDELELFLEARRKQEIKLTLIRQYTDALHSGHKTTETKIRATLDSLLDGVLAGVGKEEFRQLNKIYAGINPLGAARYERQYK